MSVLRIGGCGAVWPFRVLLKNAGSYELSAAHADGLVFFEWDDDDRSD
jgi:hypothetical protein